MAWLLFLLEFGLVAGALISDRAGLAAEGQGRRVGRGAGRHGRTERVWHEGRRPVHQDHDGRGRRLDRAVRDRRDGRAASGGAIR